VHEPRESIPEKNPIKSISDAYTRSHNAILGQSPYTAWRHGVKSSRDRFLNALKIIPPACQPPSFGRLSLAHSIYCGKRSVTSDLEDGQLSVTESIVLSVSVKCHYLPTMDHHHGAWRAAQQAVWSGGLYIVGLPIQSITPRAHNIAMIVRTVTYKVSGPHTEWLTELAFIGDQVTGLRRQFHKSKRRSPDLSAFKKTGVPPHAARRFAIEQSYIYEFGAHCCEDFIALKLRS